MCREICWEDTRNLYRLPEPGFSMNHPLDNADQFLRNADVSAFRVCQGAFRNLLVATVETKRSAINDA